MTAPTRPRIQKRVHGHSLLATLHLISVLILTLWIADDGSGTFRWRGALLGFLALSFVDRIIRAARVGLDDETR